MSFIGAINARVDAMFAAGLVDEVRAACLIRRPAENNQSATDAAASENPSQEMAPGPLSHTARQALGYREVIEHLQGEHTLSETIELVQNRTRAFARRQLTWFRSLSECRMIPVDHAHTSAEVAARIRAAAAG